MRKTAEKLAAAILLAGNLFASSQLSAGEDTIKLANTCRFKTEVEFPFQLKEIPKGKQARLRLEARIEWPSLGGNTSVLKVSVNGKEVTGRTLLNKPLKFTMREGSELEWADKDCSGYRLMYSHDFSDRIRTDENYSYGLSNPADEPYRFVWDITSLVNVGSNCLELKKIFGEFSLTARDISVEIGDPLPDLNKPEPIPSAPIAI